MAKEDYNVADRPVEGGFTAKDVVNRDPVITPDGDAAAFATSAGVETAAYANYAAALNAHESRSDIEPLAARRAREYGDQYSDADFMRDNAYKADGTADSAPRPGTVYGDADKS